MEQRRPPEYIIEVFADPSSVRDVVRGNFAVVVYNLSQELLLKGRE
jgi:hypothetical protein